MRTIAQLGKPSKLRAAPVRPVIGRLSDGGRCHIHLDGGRCQLPSDGGRCQLPTDGGRCQLPSDGGRCQLPSDGAQPASRAWTMYKVLRPRVDTPRKLCAESAVNQPTKTNITLVIRTSACRNGPLIYIQTYCVTCNKSN